MEPFSFSKAAVTGGDVVTLASSSAAATVPASATVLAGKTTAKFDVATVPVAENTTAVVQASLGTSSATEKLTIKAPTLKTFTLTPESAVGGVARTGTIKISSAAPAAGLTIKVVSNEASATVPSSVVVPAGANSTTFSVTTSAVAVNSSAKITASLGVTEIGITIKITAPVISALTVDPTSVVGGASSTGTVTLATPAPSTGLTLALHSGASSAAVPASVAVSAGATSATFTITTKPVTGKEVANVTAKGPTNTKSASLTINKTAPNRFAGTYVGSYLTPNKSIGTANFTISSVGVITGTSVDYSSGAAHAYALSGTVTTDDVVTVTTKSGSQEDTSTGAMLFNSAGDLVVLLTNNSDQSLLTVTANTSGRPLQYQGSYSGTTTNSDSSLDLISNLTISPSGEITGAAVGITSVHGKITPSGVATVTTINTQNQSETNTIYFAYGREGLLIGFTTHANKNTSIFTLTKSYAGSYQIPINNTSALYFSVSDAGVVTGASNSSSNPYIVTGTVSAAGVVNITATPPGNAAGITSLTGTMTASTGTFIGTGDAIVGSTNEGAWNATGYPSNGLVYGGSYSLVYNGGTVSLTVDDNGTITGSSTGVAFTGCVQITGAVVIFATPTGGGSSAATATLVGTVSRTGNAISGNGTYADLQGNSGTWTITGTAG